MVEKAIKLSDTRENICIQKNTKLTLTTYGIIEL